jgi:hypothetical protein
MFKLRFHGFSVKHIRKPSKNNQIASLVTAALMGIGEKYHAKGRKEKICQLGCEMRDEINHNLDDRTVDHQQVAKLTSRKRQQKLEAIYWKWEIRYGKLHRKRFRRQLRNSSKTPIPVSQNGCEKLLKRKKQRGGEPLIHGADVHKLLKQQMKHLCWKVVVDPHLGKQRLLSSASHHPVQTLHVINLLRCPGLHQIGQHLYLDGSRPPHQIRDHELANKQ